MDPAAPQNLGILLRSAARLPPAWVLLHHGTQVFLMRSKARCTSGAEIDRSSSYVVQQLEALPSLVYIGFFIEIEDLYYSVPHHGLLSAVREKITTGEVQFRMLQGLAATVL
ncbi:hypothetical protein V5799_031752 [Amblyomma americanum]|uniref:Uncharacterized protein n=1 Tax=Amblyomma americanum TaxID=6943 RepID=A0AAQ4DT50_AMBAM